MSNGVDARVRFATDVRHVLVRMEVLLLGFSAEEFSGTDVYELFGCVRDIKTAGASFSLDDVVTSMRLMEGVLLSMRCYEIGFDKDVVDCFIDFSDCVGDLMSDDFGDEATIIDGYSLLFKDVSSRLS